MAKINRKIIQDFKSVTNFKNANNIFLNINKTLIVLFQSARSEAYVPLETADYLGMMIDEKLIEKTH